MRIEIFSNEREILTVRFESHKALDSTNEEIMLHATSIRQLEEGARIAVDFPKLPNQRNHR